MEINNFFKTFWVKVGSSLAPTIRTRDARILLHWKALTVSFLLVVIIIFVGNFFLYQSISLGDLSSSGIGKTRNSATASSELLTKTINFYKTRQSAFDDLRSVSGLSSDPSR